MVEIALMRRAIRLAMNGRGRVEPNPMVGCVLERGGEVIGEGFHEFFGGPHAEPNALADCRRRGVDPAGCTAHVTLEPCCHEGKKTPPCAPALIAAGVRRVVVGCLDPNPAVNGRGVELLRTAGIDVERSDLEAEARQLIAPFLAFTTFRRPYVTLKWAESADGFVAGGGGRPVRISNEQSTRAVHELRSRCDAIAVGTNTVLKDNPLLTARGVVARRKLLRVLLSNTLNVPEGSRLARTAREVESVIYCSEKALHQHAGRATRLKAMGFEVVGLPDLEPAPERRTHPFSFADALSDLRGRGVMHLLVEAGPTLAASLLARGQADRVWVFRSPRRVDEPDAPRAAEVPWPAVGEEALGGDVLTEYLNPASEVYCAPARSADFMLTPGASVLVG